MSHQSGILWLWLMRVLEEWKRGNVDQRALEYAPCWECRINDKSFNKWMRLGLRIFILIWFIFANDFEGKSFFGRWRFGLRIDIILCIWVLSVTCSCSMCGIDTWFSTLKHFLVDITINRAHYGPERKQATKPK